MSWWFYLAGIFVYFILLYFLSKKYVSDTCIQLSIYYFFVLSCFGTGWIFWSFLILGLTLHKFSSYIPLENNLNRFGMVSSYLLSYALILKAISVPITVVFF
tara:strand:- start:11639 stop:11944 length:306 start_codon:yes stop_codon:yes gene_type:complete